jgi:hypothetical protein
MDHETTQGSSGTSQNMTTGNHSSITSGTLPPISSPSVSASHLSNHSNHHESDPYSSETVGMCTAAAWLSMLIFFSF